MTRTLFPSQPMGAIDAISSKSVAHRLLICAAFAKGRTRIKCEHLNEDITATVRCLEALGASISRDESFFVVSPLTTPNPCPVLDCGESGSTLRFLLPVACMLGVDASFRMAGRLPTRPFSPLREELEGKGIVFSLPGSNPLQVRGTIAQTDFCIAGNVSSQFISGLLFAIALSGKGGSVRVSGPLESAPYVTLTLDALAQFGVTVIQGENGFFVEKNQPLLSPDEVRVEGDWSGAAFPLAMGVIGQTPVTLCGLSSDSHQGDRAILSVLREFGATVMEEPQQITALPSPLHGISIDASQIPDLVPILATVASVAEGTTVIHHAERLRIKESDRLHAISHVLSTLGASVTETSDGLIIHGVPHLRGGEVDSFGDHRIAMSVAVASIRCTDKVILSGSEATAKSYPGFWQDCSALGMDCFPS